MLMLWNLNLEHYLMYWRKSRELWRARRLLKQWRAGRWPGVLGPNLAPIGARHGKTRVQEHGR